jgi:protein required for attachment to host cells
MPATWVVVADSSAARIFVAGSPTGAIDEIESYANAEGRAHERELGTDNPGRAFDSMGNGRHAMEQKVSPRQHEVIAFAKLVAERMHQARAKNEIGRVILVAPPEFLGHLRSALDQETRRLVESEFKLNVVRMRADEIRAHLPGKLYSAIGAR